jgi:hypothetical protein
MAVAGECLTDVRYDADPPLDDSAASPLVLDEVARRDRLTVSVEPDRAEGLSSQTFRQGGPEAPFTAREVAVHLLPRLPCHHHSRARPHVLARDLGPTEAVRGLLARGVVPRGDQR